MDKFGLKQDIIDLIINVFRNEPKIKKVIIFGSRAQGTHKHSSDIDFAIYGTNIDFSVIRHIYAELDELPTPYTFDVLAYDAIENKKLRENIDNLGRIFYEK